MKQHPGRRDALLWLASASIPAAAHAQGSILPAEPAPASPPATSPVTPPAVTPPNVTPPAVTPPRPAPVATSAGPIDKSKAHYLFFDQSIDVNSMRALRRELANLAEAGVSEITLVLDSPGGQVEPMLITYSFIQALPAKIKTHAQGFVQSAASFAMPASCFIRRRRRSPGL
jgi:membrane-bound ClpP family serine protease